jgi:translation initiation factor 3 subunit C
LNRICGSIAHDSTLNHLTDKKQKPKEDKKDDKKDQTDHKEREFKETKLIKERLVELDFSNDYTTEQYLKKMKKQTTDTAQYEDFQEPVLLKMLAEVKNKTLRIDALYFLITGMFSIVKGHVDYFMERNRWNNVVTYINEVMDLLEEKVEISEKRKGKIHIYKFFESAHKELHTSFQRLQPQNVEYVKRLHDEHKLLILGERVLKHYKEKDDDLNIAKTSLILLNHLYAKHNSVYRKMQKLLESRPESERAQFYVLSPEKTEAKINELVKNVYNEGYSRNFRIQATLYQIYHHAIHNRFYTARDQMSTAQLSEKINKQEEDIQILYNRTIVQIGLSAFRIGHVDECFDITKEIANYGKLKDLLAQSVKSNSTEKQILKEKKRFIPAHLQIDCELVDFTHMVCAMLLEIPNISRNELYIERNIISRPYRKLIDSADKTLFNGPPEQSRDFIIYASRALFHGEWRKAVEHLFGATKMWKLIPEFDEVKKVLTNKIKEVAFKVLMFRNSRFYDSYSISDLGDLFDLKDEEIKTLVSKLIVREKLNVSIKKQENIVQINEAPLNEMQSLANVLTQKMKVVIDHNLSIASSLNEARRYTRNRSSEKKDISNNNT